AAPGLPPRPGRPSEDGAEAGAALPKANALTVGVARVEQGDLALHFNALGTVTAFNTVNVKPRVNGELVK
ncbi:multidrug efflux RND transporter periplasmic adaptor subunit MuxA, partial [Pseudomonas aeruginosa]